MSVNSSPTQCEALLEYLSDHGEGITALEALNALGIGRLAARIYELKQEGHAIEERMVELPNGKRVSRYSIKRGNANAVAWVCTKCGGPVIPSKGSVADSYAFAGCSKCGKQVVARSVAQ